MSRKSERLVNLTIALLHTRRHLTKSEIFDRVYGYDGSDEAKERMFERDKDELRSIGIAIDVAQLDPYFSDESGYRIHPENYSISLEGLDKEDIALLSVAVSSFESSDPHLHLRMNALASDSDSFYQTPQLPHHASEIEFLVDAIDKKVTLMFSYLNEEGVVEQRELEPYSLVSRTGFWYLSGRDVIKNSYRTFRLDRIRGEIASLPKKPFIVQEYGEEEREAETILATVRVAKGSCLDLRAMASEISTDDDFDILSIPVVAEELFLERVLWHMDNAVILHPASLQEKIVTSLEKVISLHE